jgi:hypothetical protein
MSMTMVVVPLLMVAAPIRSGGLVVRAIRRLASSDMIGVRRRRRRRRVVGGLVGEAH